MTSVPFAHVGGLPIEETVGAFSPALLVGFGLAWAKLRARLRLIRSRVGPHDQPRTEGARSITTSSATAKATARYEGT